MTKPNDRDPLAWIQQGREERPAKKAKPKAKSKPKVRATKKKAAR